MLLPVLGFLNIYFMRFSLVADHWQYFAVIGPIALAAAGLTGAWGFVGGRKPFLGPALCGTLLAMLGVLTWRQSQTYTDSVTLWRTTLARNPNSYLVQYNLGCALLPAGHGDEAMVHFQKALEICPGFSDAHNNLGNILLQKGHVDEAIAHFQKALEIRPAFADALSNLGGALFQKGQTEGAVAQFQKALDIAPNDALTRYNLGSALLKSGRADEAINQFQSVLEIRPEFAEACSKLGAALLQKGQQDEAIAHFRRALQLNPKLATVQSDLGTLLLAKGLVDEAVPHYQAAIAIQPANVYFLNNLAWVLATCPKPEVRNGPRAVELAQQAERLGGARNPAVLGTLAAAYAEAGQFPEALRTAQHALELATTQTNFAQADMLRANIALFQAGSPFHDAAQTNVSRNPNRP
jgi:tetratricopeptide (TPR) repeat protein